MKTNINHVNIIDKLEVNKPISVEKICQEFFGITEINYLHNIHSKNIVVYIYTVNYGTVDVRELNEIQKRLEAESLSIALRTNGLAYVLSY
jgi:type III secretory pathway component EscV